MSAGPAKRRVPRKVAMSGRGACIHFAAGSQSPDLTLHLVSVGWWRIIIFARVNGFTNPFWRPMQVCGVLGSSYFGSWLDDHHRNDASGTGDLRIGGYLSVYTQGTLVYADSIQNTKQIRS